MFECHSGVRYWGSDVKYPCATILYGNQTTNIVVKSQGLCLLDQFLDVGNTPI